MYRRYAPHGGNPKPAPPAMPRPQPQIRPVSPPQRQVRERPRPQPRPHPPPPRQEEKKIPTHPILGWIPSSVYNPATKKVLGMFTAEDLLLAGLIFLLLENEENQDPMLLYALLYLLISDYIDLPF